MREVYGAAGDGWLAGLPNLLAACARRWDLTLGPPFALSYNYVAPATRADGTPVVLKVGYPGRELQTEIAALRLYAGRGICRLLDAVPEDGSLLLERLLPGTALWDAPHVDDAQAAMITAGALLALHRPLPADYSFPTTADWGRGFTRLRAAFGGTTGPFPAALVDQAAGLFADLLASQAPPVLLHGDLHQGNILGAERAPWLALDPKGVAGEPAYEVGAFLRNPLPGLLQTPDPRGLLSRRVAIFAERCGFPRDRVRGWGLAQAVLSAWWTYEDHGRVGADALAVAALLAGIPE